MNFFPHIQSTLKPAGYLFSALLIGLGCIGLNEYAQLERAQKFVVATKAENDSAIDAAESRIVRQREIEKTTKKTIKTLKTQISENETTINKLANKIDSLSGGSGW
jgi:septal ring factor EnvC (AmiA/AmiB activator)